MSECQWVHHESGTSPLILSLPHSGMVPENELPDFVQSNLRLEDPNVVKTLRVGMDAGAAEMTGFFDEQSIAHHRVWTKFPRFALDVNRSDTDDVDGLAVEGHGDPKNAHGLIVRATVEQLASLEDLTRANIRDVLRRSYTEEEFQRLLRLAYHPYIRALRKAMQTAIERHGFSILLDLHTFPANTAAKIPLHPGEKCPNAYVLGPRAIRAPVIHPNHLIREGKMPDVWLIANFDHRTGQPQSCHRLITDIIRQELEGAGLHVTNGFGPFQGNFGGVSMHANLPHGQHVVAIEQVGHDLTPNRDQGSLEVNPKVAARFRPIYARIFRRLAALKAEDVKMA